MKLYVEGGGDTAALRKACREGFTRFLEKAGLKGHMPRIVACGNRRDAYESFCTAIEMGEQAVLLVDSESPIADQHQQGLPQEWLPWEHLEQRPGDKWRKPETADELQCHLMVQCMESWFLADRDALKSFFKQGFQENQLPSAANAVESIAKQQVYQSLASASRDCKTKAQYGKREHSFKILALLDPSKVSAASPWAKRFHEELKKKMGA